MDIFIVLTLLSLLGLVVGFIKPSLFRQTRKRIGLMFGGAIVIFFILFGITAPPSSPDATTGPISENQKTEAQVEQTQSEPPAVVKTSSYQIIETSKERADKASVLYVLIDPVDVSNSSFEEKVKDVVRQVVAKQGGKVSVNLFDDRDALKLAYRQYGTQTLGRARNAEETALLERHYIASFDGQLQTGLYSNTLTFFPMAFTSSAVVGKYVDSGEFNP